MQRTELSCAQMKRRPVVPSAFTDFRFWPWCGLVYRAANLELLLLVVGTVLQRRAIAVGLRLIAGRIATLVVVGALAQRGLIGIVVVELLVRLDHLQAALDRIELGSRDDVLPALRQNRRDLLLNGLNAIRSGRMGGKNLRNRSGLLLFNGFHFFEEGDERVRIVSRLPHVLRAEEIGLALFVACEFEEGKRDHEIHALIDGIAGP